MAVVSVEIPDEKLQSFQRFSVIPLKDFQEEMSEDFGYTRLVDFGSEGMSMEDFRAYQLRRKNG